MVLVGEAAATRYVGPAVGETESPGVPWDSSRSGSDSSMNSGPDPTGAVVRVLVGAELGIKDGCEEGKLVGVDVAGEVVAGAAVTVASSATGALSCKITSAVSESVTRKDVPGTCPYACASFKIALVASYA